MALTREDYARAERLLAWNAEPRIGALRVEPHWLDGDQFWYRVDSPEGREFVLVDPVRRSRQAVFDHVRLAAALIRALWEGDGHVGSVQGYGRAAYWSSSPALAAQAHQILLRLGIPAFLHPREQAGRHRNWVVSVTSAPALERLGAVLGLPSAPQPVGRPTGQVVIDARALYVGVRAVRRVPYTGCVYNLEVEGAHSFATPGAALHNCEVNGPGEARGADVGVAGGRGLGSHQFAGSAARHLLRGWTLHLAAAAVTAG